MDISSKVRKSTEKVTKQAKLVKMFTKSLNELGEFTAKRYGSYQNMIN